MAGRIPGKDATFRALETDPLNGGAESSALVETPITPTARFFVRSHGAVPHIDPAAYRLTVEGVSPRPYILSLADLDAKFERVELAAVLQCAGNRRVEMQQIAPIPGELIWDREAVSNGVWSGFRLRDVLFAAGVEGGHFDGWHAAFIGADECEKDGDTFLYGGSIPLEKALAPETLLADRLNGAPLPPDHGYPLRVFVPGYIGARSVKWVTRIVVQPTPSTNYYQAQAYKLFPSHVQPETADWDSALMLGELAVNAAIAEPQDRAIVPPGRVTIKGYALSGGRGVARVDVSTDGGATWVQAALHGDDLPFAWRLWSAGFDLPEGDYQVTARAWDTAANTQPEQIIWNFKGYMNNACPKIRLQVKGQQA
ncbi:MAG: molybdopterin-dependent oxidoreductase [bacterium]|nr:molybdopterin-dependent oxidoreductase [bacterium]